ncbi:MAG: hypothetical protein IPO26_16610 [Saprospiraceae bacterium]|nr:hypothetical protein [Saprospiraceae bacterium]
MTRKMFLTLFGLAISIAVFSQSLADTIEVTRVFGGYRYESNGNVLSLNDMFVMMKKDDEARRLMDKAISASGISKIFSFAGGFMIGWQVGAALFGGKPSWTLAGIGCGVSIIGLQFGVSANKKTLKAIDMYNTRLKGLSYQTPYDLKLGLCANGMALKMTF